MALGGEFHSNLVARHCTTRHFWQSESACSILALVAILFLVLSCNMPSAMNHFIDPVTAEDDAEILENVEEVPAPPKKKTRGPGKKNGA